MANQLFQDYLFDEAGAPIVGATVNLYTRNTTTPVLATTTTDANGLWTISYATEGRYDTETVSGSNKRRRKWDTQTQMSALEVATFRIRNPAFTFDYDVAPAAITADRQLNLPLITATDTLSTLGLAQTWTGVQTLESPVLVTPALGTPASGVMTNVTGIPAAAILAGSFGVGAYVISTSLQAATIELGHATDTTLSRVSAGVVAVEGVTLVDLSSAQTLTGKTLGAVTLGGIVSGGGQQVNNVIIGTVTPLAGFFNNLWIGDTANGDMTTGLTINMGAADNQILAGKSSDVATGMTTHIETDTFFDFRKASVTAGGLHVRGWSSDVTGIFIVGNGVTDDTTHTAAGQAYVKIEANKKSGTDVAAVGANANLFVVQNYGSTRFIVDAEGDLFADGSDVTVYDEYDDVMVLRAFDRNRGARGIIESEWDKFVHYNEQDLVSIGILGAPRSQGGLINYTLLSRFQNGAIWQLSKKLMEAERRLELAEARLAALPAGGS